MYSRRPRASCSGVGISRRFAPRSDAWAVSADDLRRQQLTLADERPEPWRPQGPSAVAGCFVCFARGGSGPGAAGDLAWAAAAVIRRGLPRLAAVIAGTAGAAYEPGLLALREGALLETAMRALPEAPDVAFVDATGRDHPRRCGLALQLGAVLGLPTVGVTHRPLIAAGAWPPDERGAAAPAGSPSRLARRT